MLWDLLAVSYTPAGVDVLLHRIVWSVQTPARRAAARDDQRIDRWRREVWPMVEHRGRPRRLNLLRMTKSARG